MGMIKEFKEFALAGNMVDMAVGIVVGGAVGKLVGDMVTNLINPIVGYFTGGVDFGSMKHELKPAIEAVDGVSEGVAALTLNYGAFISSFINFLILMFVIFIMIKMINNAKKRMGTVEAAAGPSEVDLLSEIRDALKK